MNTRADKTQENKNQSVSAASSQLQRGSAPTFKFVDNRPETVAQRKLQEMANNSLQVSQLKAYQEIADNYSTLSQCQAQTKQGKFTIGRTIGNYLLETDNIAATVPIQRSSALKPIQFNGSDSEEEVDPSAYAEFDHAAHNEFLRNEIYREWVDKILQGGSVNVSTSANDPYAPRACWNTHYRQILIQKKFGPSLGRASMMAFEMTNAYQDNKARDLDTRARQGDFENKETSGDTLYAHEAEKIEYDGLKLHHTMMQWGITNLGWSEGLDTYANLLSSSWSTFEGYLADQEKKGHTNMHRSNYNQSLNPNRV